MADWKNILGAVAPKIAGALGGPLAGSAVSLVSQVLLGKNDGTEDEIALAMQTATPDELVKLKEADNNFEIAMAKINADDRKDARLLARMKGMWPQIVLSAVYITGYFTVLGFLVTNKVTFTPGQETLLNVLIGALTVGVTNIMQFWFGSSSGSKSKD